MGASRPSSSRLSRGSSPVGTRPSSRSETTDRLAGLRRDREELLTAFLVIRSLLRDTHPDQFVGGEHERSRLLEETEHDSVALAPAGAEALRLETVLERADRDVTDREADSAALVIAQMRELVAAVNGRLPRP